MKDSTDRVGIDISTMEGIQSLFGERALDCLANWFDVTVNHHETLFARPPAHRRVTGPP
jgi:hypothetical protein